MPIVQFTEKDLKRQVILSPAWYRVRVDAVVEKLAANGQSTNFFVEMTTLKQAETGMTEGVEGVPLVVNFNTLAISFAIGFLNALGQEVKPGVRFDLAAAEGQELEVFVENEQYQGRTINKINHKYRKVTS